MAELRRTISTGRGIALAVSMVVGSGLLGLPGLTIEAGGAATALAGWLLTVAAMFPLIAVFTSLGARYASSAGLSRYAQEAVGGWAGHGVTAILCGTFTIGIPALALIGGAYVRELFSWPAWTVPVVAATILALMTAMNMRGIKVASAVNAVSLVALLGLVAAIVATKSGYLVEGASRLGSLGAGSLAYQGLWKVCALLFWAFLGWENMSFGLEEFERPRKTIPRVFWGSFALVSVLYLALAATTIGASVSGVPVTGSSGLSALVGTGLVGKVLVAVMVLVILANANAWVFGASRLIYSAGSEGILPRSLGKLDSSDVPRNALLALMAFYAGVCLVIGMTGLSVSTLILLVSQNFLVLYAVSILAYWKTEESLVRVPVTLAAILACSFFLSGFSWWIAYPLGLGAVGWAASRRRRAPVESLSADGRTGAETAPVPRPGRPGEVG